jgi:hypothetical protein
MDLAALRQTYSCWVIGETARELDCEPSRDLSHFQGMRQARALKIAVAEIQDLGVALQSSK